MIAQTSTTATHGAIPRSRAALPRSIKAGSLRMDPSFADGLLCPECGGKRMTRILLTLTDGAPVDIVCCQSCDYHAWRSTDGTLELEGVLVGLGGSNACAEPSTIRADCPQSPQALATSGDPRSASPSAVTFPSIGTATTPSRSVGKPMPRTVSLLR